MSFSQVSWKIAEKSKTTEREKGKKKNRRKEEEKKKRKCRKFGKKQYDSY